MAYTVTVAQFQVALGLCADAIGTKSWDDAWTQFAVAETLLAGLETDVGQAGAYARMRQNLKGLRETLEKVEARSNRAGDTRRFIKLRLGNR